ncbi:MAG: hypothetical protein MJ071_02065 [Oscillospiraceae bacterium]|nr:hypothetical protein [Oscillospiraceae bacterium]
MNRGAALFLCLMLSGCGTAAPETAEQTAEKPVYSLTQGTLDLSFFVNPVAPAETAPPSENPLYHTQITSADGVILAKLQNGEWNVTEEGESCRGFLESIFPDAIVGPEITNVLRISMEKEEQCAQILQKAGIEGCVIVSDPQGQIDMICNNPPDVNYAAAQNFNGSTAKILISAAMLDHGTEEQYDDPGFYDPGWHRYYNHDTTVPYAAAVTRSLKDAFTVSSNAYFMHAACELLTHGEMKETYNRYFGYNVFGSAQSGYYYPGDWMQIPQPDWDSIADSTFERGKSAIGLSDQVMITPLYLNAVTMAIASDGMYQMNVRQDSAVRKLTEAQAIPEEMKQRLWENMDSCAAYTNKNIFSSMKDDGYQFYIKTGTADTHYGENNEKYLKRLLLTGFLTKDGQPVKIITMYCHNGAVTSFGSGSGMAQYYKEIAQLMLE